MIQESSLINQLKCPPSRTQQKQQLNSNLAWPQPPLHIAHLLFSWRQAIILYCILQQYYLTSMTTDLNQTNASLPSTQIVYIGKQTAAATPKCSICQQEQKECDSLIKFCDCKNNKNLAHAHCMQSFLENRVNKMLEIEADHTQALVCGPCGEGFKVDCIVQRQCCDKAKIKRNIERRNFLFGMLIIGIAISIITMGLCGEKVRVGHYDRPTDSERNQKNILIMGITVGAVLYVVMLYKLVEKFLTRQFSKIVI